MKIFYTVKSCEKCNNFSKIYILWDKHIISTTPNHHNWALIKITVAFTLIISGLSLFGMKGLLAGNVISAWFNLFVNFGLVSKYIGYKWYRQIGDLLPVAIASVVCAVISYAIGSLLNLNLYPDGIVKFLIYVILYMSWSLLFKPEAYTYTLSILPLKKIRKLFGKKKWF